MNSQGKTILLSAGLIFLYMKSQAFTAKAKGAITNSFTAFSDPVRLKLLQVNDALNSAGSNACLHDSRGDLADTADRDGCGPKCCRSVAGEF